MELIEYHALLFFFQLVIPKYNENLASFYFLWEYHYCCRPAGRVTRYWRICISNCILPSFHSFAEYENSHIWSQNGTDFRVYKPLRKTQETTGGICLAFQNSAQRWLCPSTFEKKCCLSPKFFVIIKHRFSKQQACNRGIIFSNRMRAQKSESREML